MLVSVSSDTRRALVETGEQRSPKKIPERIAPPQSHGDTERTDPIVAQTTPTVAAVPNEVPVSTETSEFKRNTIRRKNDGFIKWIV